MNSLNLPELDIAHLLDALLGKLKVKDHVTDEHARTFGQIRALAAHPGFNSTWSGHLLGRICWAHGPAVDRRTWLDEGACALAKDLLNREVDLWGPGQSLSEHELLPGHVAQNIKAGTWTFVSAVSNRQDDLLELLLDQPTALPWDQLACVFVQEDVSLLSELAKRPKTLKICLRAGLSADQVDHKGRNLLFYVREEEMRLLLVQAGAHLTRTDVDSQTPYEYQDAHGYLSSQAQREAWKGLTDQPLISQRTIFELMRENVAVKLKPHFKTVRQQAKWRFTPEGASRAWGQADALILNLAQSKYDDELEKPIADLAQVFQRSAPDAIQRTLAAWAVTGLCADPSWYLEQLGLDENDRTPQADQAAVEAWLELIASTDAFGNGRVPYFTPALLAALREPERERLLDAALDASSNDISWRIGTQSKIQAQTLLQPQRPEGNFHIARRFDVQAIKSWLPRHQAFLVGLAICELEEILEREKTFTTAEAQKKLRVHLDEDLYPVMAQNLFQAKLEPWSGWVEGADYPERMRAMVLALERQAVAASGHPKPDRQKRPRLS